VASAGFKLDDYVTVAERLELFRKDHPGWGLIGQVVVDDGKRILYQATVTDDTGRPIATGHAEEIRGDGPVNRTNPVENAETSAWGRALANLGYEVKRGIASREEIAGAQARADTATSDPARPMSQGHLLAQAAARAGFKASKDDDAERRKEIDTARRDVLQAVTGVRSSKEIKKAHDVKAALDAFEAIADRRLELAYDPEGAPILKEVAG
jgi:hypothetical protein